ncbi:hypothetical protein JHK85_056356 [Glycine max]|nr:hypothetical protein JHK85_056356 [Glycine max]
MDDLLMQFKDTVDSIQRDFKRTDAQLGKLVDDMTKVVVRREEEYAKIESHQETAFEIRTVKIDTTKRRVTERKWMKIPKPDSSAAHNWLYIILLYTAPDFQFPQTCAVMCDKQHAPCYDICHGCYFQITWFYSLLGMPTKGDWNCSNTCWGHVDDIVQRASNQFLGV